MTTDEGGTWVMDSFLSATPETIVVSLDVDPVAETILRHRSVTVGVSSPVLPFSRYRES